MTMMMSFEEYDVKSLSPQRCRKLVISTLQVLYHEELDEPKPLEYFNT